MFNYMIPGSPEVASPLLEGAEPVPENGRFESEGSNRTVGIERLE